MSTAGAIAKASRARFLSQFPWTTSPFIIGAPMRVMSGPHLALAISKAGGLGFIGPGAKPEDTSKDLATVRELLRSSPSQNLPAAFPSTGTLPVGVGFQLWNGDLKSAVQAVQDYRPCAAWLFAPRRGQEELDEWTSQIREVYPEIQVWIQIGTVHESIEVANSAHRPNALVVQGAEAGGHGRATDGLGIMTLFPEIEDQVRDSGMSLFAAGGIADGRGVAAALSLGAIGVVMGTRFLAATEARISKGYQQEIIRAKDGAQCTTRTMLYNHLRGTTGWPEHFHDHQAGVEFEELKRRHDEADAKDIVKDVQREASEIIAELASDTMGPSSNFDPNQPIPHKSLDNTSLSPSRVILKARPHCPAQTINEMFLQRSALTAARRVAARPAVARTFTTSFVRRDAARPATPNEQAAALAGTAEKKVGSYKTLKEIRTEEDLFGPGAAPGTVPTDLEQATGIERLEILGKMEGVDIFDMRPLDASRLGTMKDPIMVRSAGEEQFAGCTGFPADSHSVHWLGITRERPIERCPECGSVYKMDYVGPEDDHHHHHPPEFEEPKTFADYIKPEYRYR
ncbi:uncharacterized protein BKA55DRAFT_595307 [Fusarium redolens]|uniref:Cytochrome c oxidase subunit 4, mitochondrial n=1 Tax=Fusarium redolens TaxID=48865 RepID=A0A9P9K4N5_FUSRE|nr:uncharacterized protein BKA55DRAFT_595307 [Fusarium redolens]KAH7244091.1 hypothetical protein BKA55DRAFT_595307 [Fusarium redolens]